MYSAMKKNVPIIAKVMMKLTRLEPMNWRVRKRPNSTIGEDDRSSIATNTARPTAPPASSETIVVDVQPQLLPSISASTIAVRLAVRTATPG